MEQTSFEWIEYYDTVIPGKTKNWEIGKDINYGNVWLRDFSPVRFNWIFDNSQESKSYCTLTIKPKPQGKILMAGLGIGFETFFLMDKAEVTEIIVVEHDKEIIELVEKFLKHKKLTIIHSKILHYLQTTKEKFDFIYFDIFHQDPYAFPDETKILTDAANPLLNKNGRIQFWKAMPPLDL